MPTPSEQKALAFVALIVLLGGVVRIVRGGAMSPSQPSAGEQQALARQTYSASSSAATPAGSRGAKGRKTPQLARAAPDTGARAFVGGVMAGQRDWRGLPPPSPRIDVGLSPRGGSLADGAAARGPPPEKGPIDLDTATEAEIEALPRVGPALARRIVANRDSLGPFGAIAALGRVRGLGPATVKRLAALVTFSGQARR